MQLRKKSLARAWEECKALLRAETLKYSHDNPDIGIFYSRLRLIPAETRRDKRFLPNAFVLFRVSDEFGKHSLLAFCGYITDYMRKAFGDDKLALVIGRDDLMRGRIRRADIENAMRTVYYEDIDKVVGKILGDKDKMLPDDYLTEQEKEWRRTIN
ncbi:MAG: hypothetical protein LUC33_01640 [Prevotellaceae bacterium]|nr:hypothetical protein [Prevotellaceae bacterium]